MPMQTDTKYDGLVKMIEQAKDEVKACAARDEDGNATGRPPTDGEATVFGHLDRAWWAAMKIQKKARRG